ncbi:maleylpyruvate isomerase family mycothiol-dependent enzyme [Agromyces arachidis]|uniref:maleylpyruvate isomerase family mycothiol-dependent enzyme n=1 Tax=Agromyces arachidis TaxID=766966 RepID=UPI004055EEE4
MPRPDDLAALIRAFADEAETTDPAAPVRSTIWPTAGDLVDHLGQIQRWAAEQVRTGSPAVRGAFRRPDDADRVDWFREGAERLLRALADADPDRPVPALYGASGTAACWQRRMAHEGAKHLWDLRTAVDPDPRFPAEVGAAGRADAVDEFGEVFMAEARRRGIRALPGSVGLTAVDSDDAWLVSPDWVLGRANGGDATPAASIVGEVGDLALLLWERAELSTPGRFVVEGDVAAATELATTPVHL